MCSDKEHEKCKEEFETHLDWACENCTKMRHEDLHPYTSKLLRIRMLRIAGYPLDAEDLTPEEWYDLGRIGITLDEFRHP